jgi:hypothetical protein
MVSVCLSMLSSCDSTATHLCQGWVSLTCLVSAQRPLLHNILLGWCRECQSHAAHRCLEHNCCPTAMLSCCAEYKSDLSDVVQVVGRCRNVVLILSGGT